MNFSDELLAVVNQQLPGGTYVELLETQDPEIKITAHGRTNHCTQMVAVMTTKYLDYNISELINALQQIQQTIRNSRRVCCDAK